MRRALTAGLALYLGLGEVLSSPVQVQVPFELSRGNVPEAEDIPGSESEFHLPLFPSLPFHRGGPRHSTCARDRENGG